MKQVDLEEPTTLSDQEYWGCTQRECKPNLKIAQESKDVLESLISARTIGQLLGWERSHADAGAWSWKGMRRNDWKGTAKWHTRKSSNKTKSPQLVRMIANSKMKNKKQLENRQKFLQTSS